MDRNQLITWLSGHPEAIRGNPGEFLQRCERTVRRHAGETAWRSARRYVEQRMHDWEHEWGARAGEAHVAIEVCRQLAYELRGHEPAVEPGDEDRLVGGPLHAALSEDGWAQLSEWVRQVAAEEEHRVWREIVRFTGNHGRRLVRARHLSGDHDWEHTRPYTEIAAEIAEALAHEYSMHAHPRAV